MPSAEKTVRDAVECCFLFQRVPRPQLDGLIAACRTRRCVSGDLVCAEGELPQCVWIVASGGLSYLNRSADGGESIVGVVGRGTVVGLACFTDGQGMHSEVRAHRDSALVEVPFRQLGALAERHPTIWRAIATLAFTRLRILVEVRRAQGHSNLRSRIGWQLLSHLPHLAQAEPATGAPHVPVSQEDLAKLVGASRSRVNQELRALQRGGVVHLGYRGITVLEPARLASLVDSRILALEDSPAKAE